MMLPAYDRVPNPVLNVVPSTDHSNRAEVGHSCRAPREYPTCVVLLMKDDSTRRVYRLHDFTKSQRPAPGHYYCVSGKVNSADKLYLVIDSIKLDTKHGRDSTVPAPADGAGGRPTD